VVEVVIVGIDLGVVGFRLLIVVPVASFVVLVVLFAKFVASAVRVGVVVEVVTVVRDLVFVGYRLLIVVLVANFALLAASFVVSAA